MENTTKMASDAQINYLKKLGYQGSTANLTSEQANNLIRAWSNRQAAQEQQNQGYQQQPANYQQAPIAPQEISGATTPNYIITTRTGEELMISPEVVDAYICQGLTPTEFNYFFTICKTYQVNPFLKDIYAIKFGNQPATFVIDYKVMQQAADNNPAFDGLEVGIIYLDKNGTPQERKGAYILPGETLIAGWCDVFRKDRTHANRTYALYSENVKTKVDGTINAQWANKPVFMCVKVAKAQALRETFPNMFSNNTYTADEMPERDEETIINSEYQEPTVEKVKEKQKKKTATKTIAPEDSEEWPD